MALIIGMVFKQAAHGQWRSAGVLVELSLG